MICIAVAAVAAAIAMGALGPATKIVRVSVLKAYLVYNLTSQNGSFIVVLRNTGTANLKLLEASDANGSALPLIVEGDNLILPGEVRTFTIAYNVSYGELEGPTIAYLHFSENLDLPVTATRTVYRR